MKQIVVRFLMGAALLALTAVPAAAQMELGVGYARQQWNDGGTWFGANGFGIDFALPITSTDTRSFSIIADLSRTSFSDFDETDVTIVGGVRFKFLRNRRVNVFVQGTAGVLRWNVEDLFGDFSGTDPLIGAGGGVQFVLTDLIDVKAQVDFWGTKNDDQWQQVNKVFVAAVFKFGS